MRPLYLTVALVLAAACGREKSNSTPADGSNVSDAGVVDIEPLASLGRLTVDDRYFRDGAGRAVILRGVNLRVDGLFDVSFDDGRTALEHIPELRTEDCERVASLGFGFVRLPVNWSGIEPTKDVFDEAYLKRMDAAIRCFREQGVYTLIDMHQDAYSKEIGEDGAPLWAIVPKPDMLLQGPIGDSLDSRRSSAPVFAAFASFFAAGDEHGLQAEYIAMLEHVAARYARDDSVIGIDLFNEPVTSVEALAAFNAAAAKAVRSVAPDMVIVFEPTGLWGMVGGEPVKGKKMPVAGAIFAPHIYELVVGGTDEQLANLTREDIEPSFRIAKAEASAWGTPWMIGEFGAGPSVTNYQTYLTQLYDLQDEYLVSSALWLWKEDSQGRWGLFDRQNEAWPERRDMVELVSRPYARRIAGTPKAMRFADDALVVSYEDALELPNLIFVPERFAVESVRCDAERVAVEAAQSGIIEVVCAGSGAHELSIGLTTR
jgi:endoglycosylceramidase